MMYIIDIDGTLMDGAQPLPGSIELAEFLRARNIPYLVMTNSIKAVEVQSERFLRAGIAIPTSRILNPIVAINAYLRSQGIHRVRIIGSHEEIVQVDALPVETHPEMTIMLDLEKGDTAFSRLQTILEDLETGVPVITASRSTYYLKRGRKTLDTGAFVHMLELLSGREIRNFGKPSHDFFSIAGSILRAAPQEICVIGDDWTTDISGASTWGAKSVLVRTGKYLQGDESRIEPTWTVDEVSQVQSLHDYHVH